MSGSHCFYCASKYGTTKFPISAISDVEYSFYLCIYVFMNCIKLSFHATNVWCICKLHLAYYAAAYYYLEDVVGKAFLLVAVPTWYLYVCRIEN